MNIKHFPELNYLLQIVEKRFGRPVSVPKDFELMSEAIVAAVNSPISGSTLKRLWGYDAYEGSPSPSTLDTLALYAGFKSFKDYCVSLRNNPDFVSGFMHSTCVEAASLAPGTLVRLAWNPDRLVEVKYLGNNLFRVESSVNASLQVGDEFENVAFIKGYPMFLPHIVRNGEQTPMYIAGIQDGLTRVELLPGSRSHE